VLRKAPDRLPEKRSVNLQLALAHVGLNDAEAARVFLRELYALDAGFQMDPQQFSPKVVALAKEAKAAEDEIRCLNVHADAQRLLESEETTTLLALIRSNRFYCSGLDALEPHIAEILYAQGIKLYKSGDHAGALLKLRGTVDLNPKHELATQYIELIQTRLAVSVDRMFLEWQKRFAARDYAIASTHYHELSSEPRMLDEIRTEYRNAVSKLVDAWKDACGRADKARMAALRAEAAQMLPDPSIAQDLLSQMTACTSTGCLEMNAQLALVRLKARVNPVFRTEVKSVFNVMIHARISETGSVTVNGIESGNPAFSDPIRAAVERWKFSPIADDQGPRCVDTEIPMTIRPAGF
jgi:hypothetical protein